MDDINITEMFFNRDEGAIEETQKKYGEYIRAVAYNITGTAEDASECENDTYLKLWNSIPPERPDNFKAYLGRIARNAALSIYRKSSAAKRDPGSFVIFHELEECIPSSFSTEEHADAEYVSSVICAWLKSLKAEDRVIFVKRYWYGDSVGDISVSSGFSASKISQRLFSLRKKLRKELAEKGVNI